MTSIPTAPLPGWYADPYAPGFLRFFDGVAWTAQVSPVPPHPPAGPFTPPVTAGYPPALGESPDDPVHWLIPLGRTWQSIAAGYLGIFALFIWVLGPVAVAAGVWALRVSSRGGAHGRGRAVFGIVAGALATVFLAVLIASMA
jgi:hypothetical protein